MTFLNKGLKITFEDRRLKEDDERRFHEYHNPEGLLSYVKFLNESKHAIHKSIFSCHSSANDVEVEVSLQYTDSFHETILTFANNINNPDGGTHMTGFKNTMTRAINDFARKSTLVKEKEDNLTGDDIREGVTAIVSVKVKDPQFESQTKVKLLNNEVVSAVQEY